MKSSPLLLCLLALVPPAALAESPFEREVAQLREQRDKALAAASEPVNRRYQAALEQTLRKAMQAGDLDAAVKIKAALAELTSAASTAPAKSPLQALMEGSRWEWFNAAEPKGQANNWVEFYQDGLGRSGWNQPLHYAVTGANTVRISQGESGPAWFFVVDAGKREARPDPIAGAGHESRSMRLERRISPLNPAR